MNEPAVEIIENEIKALEARVAELDAQRATVRTTIKSLRASVIALIGASSPPASGVAEAPSPETTSFIPAEHKICFFSGENGIVRIMSSKMPIEDVVRSASFKIGPVDFTRSVVFFARDASTAERVVFKVKNVVKNLATAINGVYERDAFDYGVSAILSGYDNLRLMGVDWFSTTTPTVVKVAPAPVLSSFEATVEWTLDQFVKMNEAKAERPSLVVGVTKIHDLRQEARSLMKTVSG